MFNAPEATRQVRCVPLRLSASDALARVNGGVRSLWPRRYTHATLRYKPHWEVAARLMTQGRTPDIGHGQLVAVVDGLTGIARCRRPGSPAVDFSAQPLEGQRLVSPTLDATQARQSAEQVIRRTARRRRVRLAEVGEAIIFYKPVWLVALSQGVPASHIIDAHSGVLARILA